MSKPFILIKLDKEYELRFSNLAAIYFEEITGKSLQSALNNTEEVSIYDMNALIYGGIKSKNKDISFQEVVELVDEYADISYIAEKIKEAIEESTFFTKASNKKNPKVKS